MQPRSQVSHTQAREKTLGTRLDYIERDSAGAKNPSPVWSSPGRNLARGRNSARVSHIIKTEFGPGLKAGNNMAAARKQKRFQWNLGNKIGENRIHFLSNFN